MMNSTIDGAPTDSSAPPTWPTGVDAVVDAEPAGGVASAAAPHAPGRAALPTIYAGSFAAFVGVAIADVVYPLLILGFTGKPLLAGLFGAIQFTALVLVSVPAGNFADRHDRRRILIGGETVRAALATVLAVSLASGHVWLVEIYLIAAVLGACQPFSGVRTLALRKLAPDDKLIKVLSIQQGVSAIAELVGPAFATLLYSIDRALPFAAVAGGLAVSALCAFLVRFDGRPEPAPAADDDAPAAGENDDVTASGGARSADSPLAGLAILWHRPVMRSTLIFIMLFNLVAMPLELVVMVQARHEGIPTHYLGLIFACSAAGGLIGAPVIPRLHGLLRPGRQLGVFGLVVTLACATMALPLGGFAMAAGFAAIGFVVPAAQLLVDVLILQQVPDHQRGRVLGALSTLIALGTPIGAAFGGTLLQILPPTAVLFGIAGSLGCVTLYSIAQRDLRRAEWPTSTL